MDISQFEARKRDHLHIALEKKRQALGLSGLDRVQLVHDALPELDFSTVSLKSTLLGKPSPTPYYIASMTAGHEGALHLNRKLAEACQRRGWALGVGSQRRELECESREAERMVDGWEKIRVDFPNLQLLSNIGLAQLISTWPKAPQKILALTENLGAQALIVHLNALQETLQPEGTPEFAGGLEALQELCKKSRVPVILKETGCGFSKKTLLKLRPVVEAGLAAIDVSGLGGTHWGRIEGARSQEGHLLQEASITFAEWGVPTVDSVLAATEVYRDQKLEVWASGGVRTGLDAAKLLALGAQAVGFAQPALQAAMEGAEALGKWMEKREFELKIALFCTGSRNPGELRQQGTAQEAKWTINNRF